MKELSIEEKAKRFDKAINLVNSKWHYKDKPCFIQASEIFPELKESEDEKMWKLIKKYAHYNISDLALEADHITREYLESWLEKQGEQKPVDKVEPMFKDGQWIVWKDKCYKVNYNGCGYELVDQNGLSTSLEYGTIDENAHLWTIKDAKDGDVLYFNDNTIAIFKNLYNSSTFYSYCHIENGVFAISKNDMPDWWDGEGFQPAIKEQRDLLFTKMKEAGYKWDAEKKVLKKIEQTPVWTKEDDKKRTLLIRILEVNHPNGYFKVNPADTLNMEAIHTEELVSWLKSLKSRIKGE